MTVTLAANRNLLTWQFPGATCDQVRAAIVSHGVSVRVGSRGTRELSPAVATYRLGDFPIREGMAVKLGLVEGLMMVAGVFDGDAVRWAAPKANMDLFGPLARYGPRVGRQLEQVVNELQRDPTTRRASVVLPDKGEAGTPDLPCTSSIQFLARSEHLDMVVAMRSWDAHLGMSTDVLQFGVLGLTVAAVLRLLPGRLTVSAGSLHGYDDTISLVRGGTIGSARLALPVSTWSEAQRLAAHFIGLRDRQWLKALFNLL